MLSSAGCHTTCRLLVGRTARLTSVYSVKPQASGVTLAWVAGDDDALDLIGASKICMILDFRAVSAGQRRAHPAVSAPIQHGPSGDGSGSASSRVSSGKCSWLASRRASSRMVRARPRGPRMRQSPPNKTSSPRATRPPSTSPSSTSGPDHSLTKHALAVKWWQLPAPRGTCAGMPSGCRSWR